MLIARKVQGSKFKVQSLEQAPGFRLRASGATVALGLQPSAFLGSMRPSRQTDLQDARRGGFSIDSQPHDRGSVGRSNASDHEKRIATRESAGDGPCGACANDGNGPAAGLVAHAKITSTGSCRCVPCRQPHRLDSPASAAAGFFCANSRPRDHRRSTPGRGRPAARAAMTRATPAFPANGRDHRTPGNPEPLPRPGRKAATQRGRGRLRGLRGIRG
jgi:hypothetical protein